MKIEQAAVTLQCIQQLRAAWERSGLMIKRRDL